MVNWPAIDPTEHQEQRAVIEWCQAIKNVIPEADLIFAIPNGRQRPRVYKNKQGQTVSYSPEGRRLKLEGVKRGIPDLFLPVARHGYHGLFIEMKSKTGKLTAEQEWQKDRLFKQGYAVVCSQGAQPAINAIKTYLERGFTWGPNDYFG